MASIGWEGKRARIQFRDSAGKQKTLRLGECPKAEARTACAAVGHLVVARRHNGVPHPDAVRWLEGIDDMLYARVVALGLCQPRAGVAVVTLGMLLDRVEAATVVKPGTLVTYRQAFDMLREHFGSDAPLESITPADADEWRKAIGEPVAFVDARGNRKIKKLAAATIAKRVKVAKAVFKTGVKWRLISSNPFADLRAGSQANPDRAFYVPLETVRKILEACPNAEWRAVLALSRLAGLRCPSELVGLRWSDVNWERGALTVRSPKNAAHEAHAVRTVPIDPELRVILQELFDQAEPGADLMLPSHRNPGENLRTPIYRILSRAGVKPWPRLMHNMRASCENDWFDRFPGHSVASWMGHGTEIAATHYLRPRDAHFNLAAGVERAATNPATHMHPPATTGAHVDYSIGARFLATPEKSGSLVAGGVARASVEKQKTPAEARVMTPMGFEPMSLP
jgi:integrase